MFRPSTRNLGILFTRKLYTHVGIHRAFPSPRALLSRTTVGLTLSSLALATIDGTVFADTKDREQADQPTSPLCSMIRAYVVFSMCSIPRLVDAAPTILNSLSSVPLAREVIEVVMRLTFFKQFVGGDTVDDCVPVVRTLRRAKQGVLFSWSVETHDNNGTSAPNGHQRAIQDLLHSIDVAADFEDNLVTHTQGDVTVRQTWIAIKLSTLLSDPRALTAFSEQILNSREFLPRNESRNDVPFPGIPRWEDLEVLLNDTSESNSAVDGKNVLTQEYVRNLQELYSNLVRICTRAKERGVKVTIDAEESWYAPAVDVMTLALMRRFNALSPPLSTASSPSPNLMVSSNRTQVALQQPLIYLTLQAYLRRAPSYLAFFLLDAKNHNYALGVKLVRGAYIEGELEAHSNRQSSLEAVGRNSKPGSTAATSAHMSMSISPDDVPPVWSIKRETDEVYDDCARVLINEVREDVERSRAMVASNAPEANGEKKPWFDLFQKQQGKGQQMTVQAPSPRIAVIFGTHNWKSSQLVLSELVKNRLGEKVVIEGKTTGEEEDFAVRLDEDVVQRVTTSQLYGMSDELSEWITSHTITNSPFVIRYLPYGPLRQVMPYLARRAIENKSILGNSSGAAQGEGGADRERRRAWKAILQLLSWRGIFGFSN